MTTRGMKTGIASLILVALVIIGILLVNLIAHRAPSRLDLTSDSRYTLAEPSIAIAEALPDAVRVELFFSPDLPPEFEQMRRDVSALLVEYQASSGGLLTYQFVDPTASEDERAHAHALGVDEWPLQVNDQSGFGVRRAWTGLTIIYDHPEEGERHQTIARLMPGMNYEYNISRELRSVVSDEPLPTIGFVIGDGGFLDPIFENIPPFNPQNPQSPEEMRADLIQRLEEQLAVGLEDQFAVKIIDITEDIPETVDGLLMAGSTAEFDSDMQRRFDQFIMSGRPVAVFISPYRLETLDMGNQMAQFQQPIQIPSQNQTGLGEMLAQYGVVLEQDAIIDVALDNAQVSARQFEVEIGGQVLGSTWVPTSDPRLPIMTKVSRTSLITPNMGQVAFLPIDRRQPLSQSSLRLTNAAQALVDAGALEVDEVLRTSDTSFRYGGDGEGDYFRLDEAEVMAHVEAYELSPDAPAIDLEQGPFTTAITLVGQMDSALDAPEIASTEAGRLFVVSNGYWMQAQFLQQDPIFRLMGSLGRGVAQQVQAYAGFAEMLFQNTTSWLAQDTELVRIRVRQMPAYADAAVLDDTRKTRYKVFNIAGVPAIFCFLGLCGFLVRQYRRSRIQQQFNE